MKLSGVLLLIGFLQVSAAGLSQNSRINLEMENAPLEEFIAAIEDQTEVRFVYLNENVKNKLITVKAKRTPVTKLLDRTFNEAGIDYRIISDNLVVITPNDEYATPEPQPRTITGTIIDEDGESLIGVTITVKGTTVGTITDIDGKYTIEIPPDAEVLVFSYVGMITQEIPIGDQTIIDLTMAPDIYGLEEVVVVGYGVQKKVNLTGAVTAVGSDALEERPIANVQQALQGLVPNLIIAPTTAGGEPGADMSMNIRGLTTFEELEQAEDVPAYTFTYEERLAEAKGSSNAPYVLVDGIPMGINDVDPNDIESISVLKDAASTAIYGARAAYGVILITTKKGQAGAKVTYSTNIARSRPTIYPDYADPLKAIYAHNDAAVNSGRAPYYDDDAINRFKQNLANPGSAPSMLANPDGLTWNVMNTGMMAVANEDWNELIIKDWAPRQKHNLSISGGTDRVNYYVSAGYYDEEGLLKIGNEWFKKYNVDTKIEAKVTSWMNISFLAKYRHGHENFPWNQFYGRAWIMNWISKIKPGLPAKYDGTDIWTKESRIQEWKDLREDFIRKQLVASPRITLEPLAGWVTNIELNYVTNNDQYETMVKQIPWLRPNGEIAYEPSSRAETEYNSSLFSNDYLSPNIYSSYTRSFGRHNLNVMAGYQQEVYKYNDLMAESFHVVTDAVPSITTAVGEKTIDDNVGHWATRSVFGRLNYNFSERYLLEINIRRDGSSRFEEDERWGTFPSVSAGWIISNENFFPLTDQIDFLKIRGSYGTLGNQNVANYLYVPRLPTEQTNYWLLSGERPWTVGAPDLTSVNLTWEKVKTIDFGIDVRTLNNRLAATFDWYESRTTDLVGPGEALPSVLGTDVPKKNEGEIMTRGWELEISWKSRVNDFLYGFRGIISDYMAKVTNYRNPTKILSTYYEGMVLGEIWGFESGGLYQSDADITAWGIDQSYIYGGTWYPGDQKYIDQDGDGAINIGTNTVDDPGDKVILGNNTPRFQYGLNANASWKGFDISLLFQGIAKRDLDMRTLGIFRGPANGPMHAGCLVDHLDYWRDDTSPLGANPDAYFPRPYSQYIGQNGKNYDYPSDRYLQNGAYFRLKNVILGYTLPASLTQKVFISNARIYLSGENLLTFTDLMFFDPESFAGRWYGAGDAYPLSKMYSIGLTVTF